MVSMLLLRQTCRPQGVSVTVKGSLARIHGSGFSAAYDRVFKI